MRSHQVKLIPKYLTHWGRVMHICISKLAIVGSDNGLSPDQRQAIIWTNAGILLIGPLGTNLNQNSYIFIRENAFENVIWKMAAILSRRQCVNGQRKFIISHFLHIVVSSVPADELLVALLRHLCMTSTSNAVCDFSHRPRTGFG